MRTQQIRQPRQVNEERMQPLQHTPEAYALEFVQGHQGQPLAGGVREVLEPKFAHNFGEFRVFADGQASQLARDLDAKVFTVGQKIVFGGGEYQPHLNNGLGFDRARISAHRSAKRR